MAYEISSSVGTSGITPQVVDSATSDSDWTGGAINPAGTQIAIPSSRHLGASDSVDNFGIEILVSGSSGWAKADSIDTSAQIHWIKFKSDSEFFAGQSGYVYNYVSSSSGWSQGDASWALQPNYHYHGYFNHDFTQFAATQQYSPSSTSTMDNGDVVWFFESGSGGWSSKQSFTSSVGKTTSISWINDDTVMLGQPQPGTPANGRIYVIEHDGTSWNTLESADGERNSSHPFGLFGMGLYYHTASNSTIIATIDSPGTARFWVMPSGSYGYLPLSAQAGNTAGIFTEISVAHLTASGRSYLRGSYGSGWNIDPSNGDRIVVDSYDDGGTQRDEKVFFAIESGSDGWKASKAINADCDGVGRATDGYQHSQLSSGGSTLVAFATGSYSSTLSRVTIYNILEADPAIDSVVSFDLGAGLGTTIQCDGTESSPEASLTIQANSTTEAITFTCDSTAEADPKKNRIAETIPGAIAASKVFKLTPHNTFFDADRPATFTFKLTGDYAGTEPANLKILKRSNSNSGWAVVSADSWSVSSGTVTLSLGSLSEIAAAIGGNNMARTKLNNYQLEKLLSQSTGEDGLGASVKALDIIGSGTVGTAAYVAPISDHNNISDDHFFVAQSASAAEPVKIAASVLKSYFSEVTMTNIDEDNSEFQLIFKSGSNLGYDSDGVTWNPSSDTLTLTNMTASSVDINGGAIDGATLGSTNVIDVNAIDLDSATALVGATMDQADLLLIDDGAAGAMKSVTFSNFEDSIFSNVSGDVTIAAGGAATMAAAQTNITSLLATDIKIGEDDETKIDFETPDEIHFYAANAEQVYVADGVFGPETDSDVDLGSTGARWKDAYVDSVTVTDDASIGGNLTLTGTGSISGDLTVTGDLTINGTTTTVNSTEVTIDDKAIVLADGANDTQIDAAGGAGLKISSESSPSASFLYDGVDSWDLSDHLNLASGQEFKINDVSMLSATTLGSTVISSSLQRLGTQAEDLEMGGFDIRNAAEITASSNVTVGGQLSASSAQVGDLTETRLVFAGANGELQDAAGLAWDGTFLSASNVSASSYVGDGSGLSGVGASVANKLTGGDHYVTFVASTSSAESFFVESGSLKYNPDSDLLTATNITASNDVSIDGNLDVTSGLFKMPDNAAGKLLVADGTSFQEVAMSGDVAIASDGATTIQANAVEGSMLNTDVISAQTEMTGDLADTDELMVSDAGVLKRADFSVVRDAVFNDVSGDAVIAAGGALTIQAGAVEHGMLNDDIISGQSELAHANIADADDLMIHDADAAEVKKVGVDSLRDHFFGVVSGDATIADGGALSIGLNAVSASMLNDDIKGNGIQVTDGVISVSAHEEVFTSSSMTAGLTASLALSSSQMLDNSLAVYLNGMLQLESGSVANIFDFEIDATNTEKILMVSALDSDDILTVRYIKK